MKHHLRAIRQPLITEKSTIIREKDGTYCFKVHPDANKIEIARAIEFVFQKDKVKVAKVRTARVRGKVKRVDAGFGRNRILRSELSGEFEVSDGNEKIQADQPWAAWHDQLGANRE